MPIKSFFRFITLALIIAFTTPILAAEDASMHDVYLAAEAGKFSEAQAMMDKVLHDHPNSAKAHFVEAELLAKQGRLSGAADELNTAERLKPGLPFAKPQAIQKLKSQIASITSSGQQTISHSYAPAHSNGLPWGMIFLIIGLIAFIYLAAKWMTRRNLPNISTGSYPYANNGVPQQYGNLQPYGSSPASMMPPTSGGIGSGILGGLATGAALGAGMVAGEALVHHFTDGDHNSSNNSLFNDANASVTPESYNDMGGSDFGVADNSSWDDDSGGGDDWS